MDSSKFLRGRGRSSQEPVTTTPWPTVDTLEFSTRSLRFKSAQRQTEFIRHLQGSCNVTIRILACMSIFMALTELTSILGGSHSHAWIQITSACILSGAGALGLAFNRRMGREVGILLCGLIVVDISVSWGLIWFFDADSISLGFEFTLNAGLVLVGCAGLHPPITVVAVLTVIPPLSTVLSWTHLADWTEGGTLVFHGQLLSYYAFMCLAALVQMSRNCSTFVLVCKLQLRKESQVRGTYDTRNGPGSCEKRAFKKGK